MNNLLHLLPLSALIVRRTCVNVVLLCAKTVSLLTTGPPLERGASHMLDAFVAEPVSNSIFIYIESTCFILIII